MASPPPGTLPALIVGSGGESGINMSKALAGEGVSYVYTLDTKGSMGAYLPTALHKTLVDDMDNVVGFKRWNTAAILPASSKVIEHVYRWLESNPNLILCMPDKETWSICRNKADTYSILGREFRWVTSDYHAGAAGDDLGYPFWMRAPEGSGAAAASRIDTPRQAVAWYWYWKERDPGLTLMAEPYLTGTNVGFKSVLLNGSVVESFCMERVEWGGSSAPSGIPGTPLAARTMPPVETEHYNEKAVQAIRLIDPNATGPFCVDFQGGQITEINAGRLTTLSCKAWPGVNLPYTWLKLAHGVEPTFRGFDCAEPRTWIIRNRSAERIYYGFPSL